MSARTEARLPEGTLPDGTRPRVRGLNGYPDHLAALQLLGGELVTLGDDVDLGVVGALAEARLITLDAGERGALRVGVTPGGDRALRRYAA